MWPPVEGGSGTWSSTCGGHAQVLVVVTHHLNRTSTFSEEASEEGGPK